MTEQVKRMERVEKEIRGTEFTLLKADEPHLRYMGMSVFESESEVPVDGMLFEYPREKLHRLVFRDMNFPLTVAMLDSNDRVVETGTLSEESSSVEAVCKRAVEIPGLQSEVFESPMVVDEVDVVESDGVEVVSQTVVSKRVYIDDPSEVPEGASVHRGERGGLYYDEEAVEFAQSQMEEDRRRMKEYKFTDEQIEEGVRELQSVSQDASDIFESWIETASEVANVTGASHRTKALGSALEKAYVRKSDEYGSVESLNDLHGSMIKVETVDQAEAVFERLQNEFDVVEAKDKTEEGPYRAHHLIAEVEGHTAELQIKQKDLSKIASASHKLAYKPETAPVSEMETLDEPANEELQSQLNECLVSMADFVMGQSDEVECDERAQAVIEEYVEKFEN